MHVSLSYPDSQSALPPHSTAAGDELVPRGYEDDDNNGGGHMQKSHLVMID